jgi:hypothetical protein
MARTKRAKEFQIPNPGHQPLEIEFCGSTYEFVMPSRLKADALRGYLMAALARMSAPLQKQTMEMAKKIAASNKMDVAGAKVFNSMEESEKLAIAAGNYMAIGEMFEFICQCLKPTPGERAFAEDNYEAGEVFRVFTTLNGALMRPFGGTKSVSPVKEKANPTDSENGESVTP